jgi:hypothetical protein
MENALITQALGSLDITNDPMRDSFGFRAFEG